MGRNGITYEDVMSAIESLLAAGFPPDYITTRAIRNQTGRGSMTTLNRHLHTWKERQSPARTQESLGQAQQMIKFLTKINSLEAELHQANLSIEQETRKFEILQTRYDAHIQTLQNQLDSAAGQISKYIEDLKEARSEARELRKLLAARTQNKTD